jgi:hypothetical protein
MKVSVIRRALRQTTFFAAIGVSLFIASKVTAQAIVPAALASPRPAQITTGAVAEVERVIVTGSNIPTAEETGPNPVDTYRPADIEKLGIRNATDLTTFLPQQSGATTNLNIANGGDGTVQFNLRGLLAKETLVLVDGKRVAFGSLNSVGFSGGVGGRRAMELAVPVKDSSTEPYVKLCFTIICAWTGEREVALGQLEALAKSPGYHTYGNLRLSPMWDPLRGDPRFEKIVNSLAQK